MFNGLRDKHPYLADNMSVALTLTGCSIALGAMCAWGALEAEAVGNAAASVISRKSAPLLQKNWQRDVILSGIVGAALVPSMLAAGAIADHMRLTKESRPRGYSR
jgi:hypothetical protein